ncbi:MAG TPA: hypothetical protein VI160_11710 [Gemmatimonadales bacterium]
MPSRKVLRRAARRVDRAMELFLGAAERLRRGAGRESGDDAVARQAMIEAWAVQLQALLEFFHPTAGSRSDTILAEQYFRLPDAWTRRLPRLTAKQRRRRTAQRDAIASLSYRRRARTPGWTERDSRLIELRIRLFLSLLPARRRRWFPLAARRLSAQIDLLDLIREPARASD